MSQVKNPEDPGGSQEIHHIAAALNFISDSSTPTTSKAAQDTVVLHSKFSAEYAAQNSSTNIMNKSVKKLADKQVSPETYCNSEVVNKDLNKCQKLDKLAETTTQSQLTSKQARKREKYDIPKDLPNCNFSFNDPRFLEYFMNQVGPMYSENSTISNPVHPQLWHQSQTSSQLAQTNSLSSPVSTVQYVNISTFQDQSQNTSILTPQTISNPFKFNFSNEHTSITTPQTISNPFKFNFSNEQNHTMLPQIFTQQNTLYPLQQNIENGQILSNQQNITYPFQQNIVSEQSPDNQQHLSRLFQQNEKIPTEHLKFPTSHKKSNQCQENVCNSSDANKILNPPFLTMPNDFSHNIFNATKGASFVQPQMSTIPLDAGSMRDYVKVVQSHLSKEEELSTTYTSKNKTQNVFYKNSLVTEKLPKQNNTLSPEIPNKAILQNSDRKKIPKPTKKNEKSNTTEVNEIKNKQHLENLKGHPLLRYMINSPKNNDITVKNNTLTPKEKPKRTRRRTRNKHIFEDYICEEEVEKGIRENRLYEGVLRINPKRFDHAYVTVNRDEQDIFVDGLKKRNRAMDGDIVIVEIIEKLDKWPPKNYKGSKGNSREQVSDSNDSDDDNDSETELREEENIIGENIENSKSNREGKVVFIKEKIHPRTCTGYLKLMPDNNKLRALFIPRDCRIPRMNVLATSWPDNFYKEAKAYENVIFLAKIVEWVDVRFAMGTIIRNFGESGNLHAEMIAILSENYLDVTPFGPEVKTFFPGPDFIIPEEEIAKREDCRQLCIFSIDPYNCRDVDDAMSCQLLGNGNFEIGVHISDVSFYLKEKTVLDEKVANKATTVYMVERAFHMLPEELCLLCSLFSGVDKLAFSVFWEITPDAKVLNHRFAKTVIHSCAQLSYEHAQAILDNDEVADFPDIYNGFTFEHIKSVIKVLGNLSSLFRTRRFEGGALRIDQPKLNFHLNPENGLPESFHIHKSHPSHQLIEEFMLLANITVAEKIYTDFPSLAFLRCHPEPSKFQLMDLVKQLKTLDIDLDITSSGTLYQSLLPHIGPGCENEEKAFVISMMCTKPMTRALYFCAARQEDDNFKHYALNVPLYTHFTSPIRRYADIMVHRLLSASIEYTETPKWDIDRVSWIAANCNKQKYNAKRAGEKSTELYTLKYIEMNSPVVTDAVVVEVREKSFDVVALAMNLNRRIYIDNISGVESTFYRSKSGNKLSKLDIVWPASETSPETKLAIQLFSVIQIEMVKADDIIKVETRLLRPL